MGRGGIMVEGRAFKARLGRASGPSLITSPLDVGVCGGMPLRGGLPQARQEQEQIEAAPELNKSLLFVL